MLGLSILGLLGGNSGFGTSQRNVAPQRADFDAGVEMPEQRKGPMMGDPNV